MKLRNLVFIAAFLAVLLPFFALAQQLQLIREIEFQANWGIHATYFYDRPNKVAGSDLNGDGKAEVIIGVITDTVNGYSEAGRVHVYDGASGALLYQLQSPTPRLWGHFGTSVAAGDVNGDGINDIIVGAKWDASYLIGRVYIYDGATLNLMYTLEAPDWVTQFGESVAVGDINGDGKIDVVVGSHFNDWSPGGRVYVYDGSSGSLIYNIYNDQLYYPPVAAGDVTGDGKADIIVGAYAENIGGFESAGRVYVYDGSTGNLTYTLQSTSPKTYGYFGWCVAAGDTNGDGKAEVIVQSVGGNACSSVNPAQCSVVSGDIDGDGKDERIDSYGYGVFVSPSTGVERIGIDGNGQWRFGLGGVASSDVDGDGKLDIIVRSRMSWDSLLERVYVFSYAPDITSPTVSNIIPIEAIVNTPQTYSASYWDSGGVASCNLLVDGIDIGDISLSVDSNEIKYTYGGWPSYGVQGKAIASYSFSTGGSHTLQVQCKDIAGNIGVGPLTTVNVIVPNNPPDCSGAIASIPLILENNHKMKAVSVLNVTDPDNDPVSITVTGITQDEPVKEQGSGNTSPDGSGVGTDTAWVRAERSDQGNGRVYNISFNASDGKGGQCSGSVRVCVPHDQGNPSCIDDGQIYDSTIP